MKQRPDQCDSDIRQQSKLVAVFMTMIAVVLGLQRAMGAAVLASPDVAAVYLLGSIPLAIAAVSWCREADKLKVVGSLVLGMLCAVVVPNVYLAARCRHDVVALEDLLDQSRLGEARAKAAELLRLAPSTLCRNRPLSDLARQLDDSTLELERQLETRPTNPTANDRLVRCRQLAMLGRSDDAILELIPLLQSNNSLAALDLAGTIHEANSDWEVARIFHQRAKDGWLKHPSLPTRNIGLLRATTRVAYCERKLGHYERAEQEYLEAVAMAPSAENHFLIAQFYEDMQQSTKARMHARAAMALDPRQYSQAGQKLLNKLMIGHFGCMAIFRAESAGDRAGELASKATSFKQ